MFYPHSQEADPVALKWQRVELSSASPYWCTLNSSLCLIISAQWLLNLTSQTRSHLRGSTNSSRRQWKFWDSSFFDFLLHWILIPWVLTSLIVFWCFFRCPFIYLAVISLSVSCSIADYSTNIGGTYLQWILDKYELSLHSNLAEMFNQSGIDRYISAGIYSNDQFLLILFA